ncbi:MerR family transcriptional regulator [Brevibacterium zhoupengii]|uniref:MerR family transcriptional regulator n=1 Tax=Brevibacterium zhoupengii TaxID=2898795 RepID=UPI001E52EF89|nr:MerR family transcriptional regulator [Brevibacterium zhoupengii]
MAWSTRELAELAGTSLRAVRHYHDQGLLPEPPRASNGYKHYGVRHLIQLMHIRRLVDLGVPLADIPTLDPSADSYRETLELLASEATAEIDRLVVVRGKIAQLLEEPEAWEMSSGTTGSADGDFLTVLSQVLDEDSLQAWRQMGDSIPDAQVVADFENLPEDASAEVREDVAVRMTEAVRDGLAASPELRDPRFGEDTSRTLGTRSIGEALVELYSPAQLRVLARCHELLSAG